MPIHFSGEVTSGNIMIASAIVLMGFVLRGYVRRLQASIERMDLLSEQFISALLDLGAIGRAMLEINREFARTFQPPKERVGRT